MNFYRGVALVALMTGSLFGQCGVSRSQLASGGQEKAAIQAILNAQVEAWNRHDLEAFMKGYWNSPQLTFFSGGHATSGWEGALDRYRRAYQGPGKEMGTLSFTDLVIELLSPDSAFVRGRFHLKTSDGKNPEGLFTLIWRKFPDGWHIIHDHSSSGN